MVVKFKHASASRAKAGACLFALVTNLAACNSIPLQSAGDPLPEEAASLTIVSDELSQKTVGIAPGVVLLEVEAAWTGGTRDARRFDVAMPPKAAFILIAYDREVGVVPTQVQVRQPPPPRRARTFGDKLAIEVAAAALFSPGGLTIALLTAPVWLSILAIREQAKDKRSADCCFTWIEDIDTGEVVAGISPWSQIAIAVNAPLVEGSPRSQALLASLAGLRTDSGAATAGALILVVSSNQQRVRILPLFLHSGSDSWTLVEAIGSMEPREVLAKLPSAVLQATPDTPGDLLTVCALTAGGQLTELVPETGKTWRARQPGPAPVGVEFRNSAISALSEGKRGYKGSYVCFLDRAAWPSELRAEVTAFLNRLQPPPAPSLDPR